VKKKKQGEPPSFDEADLDAQVSAGGIAEVTHHLGDQVPDGEQTEFFASVDGSTYLVDVDRVKRFAGS
jgi:hypothetical protein